MQNAWPQEVVEAIDYRQEVAYRKVADILGLAGPEEAFHRLAEPKQRGLTPEEFRDLHGYEFTKEEWEKIKKETEEYMAESLAGSAPRLEDLVWRDLTGVFPRLARATPGIIRKFNDMAMAPAAKASTNPDPFNAQFFAVSRARYLESLGVATTWPCHRVQSHQQSPLRLAYPLPQCRRVPASLRPSGMLHLLRHTLMASQTQIASNQSVPAIGRTSILKTSV